MSWFRTATFHEQLRVMLQAGLPIAESVRQSGMTAGGFYAAQAPSWASALSNGQALSDVMCSAGCAPFDVALIQAGEKSGHLPELCADIASHYRHAISLRNLVIGRLIYPVFLIHIALIAAAFPPVFMQGKSALYLIAGPIGLWLLLSASWLVWHILPNGAKARIALGKGIGFVVWPLIASNICSVLRAALKAGMLAPDALELAAGACGNRVVGDRLRQAGGQVRHGQLADVTAALTVSGLPVLVLDLCRSGEKAGSLDDNLGQATSVMRESFRLRSEWLARVACGVIYGGAMILAVVVVISFWMGYLGMINDVMKDIE